MVTNFLSRWSKRKLDETKDESTPLVDDTLEENVGITPENSIEDVQLEHEDYDAPERDVPVEEQTQPVDDLAQIESPSAELQSPTPQLPEQMSLANLLVSEVEESVKKAAMRKLFLSEEFNIRDGLDDYDEDYSQLTTLAEGVAETLREWVKEKVEEGDAESGTEGNVTENNAIENSDATASLEPSDDTSDTDLTVDSTETSAVKPLEDSQLADEPLAVRDDIEPFTESLNEGGIGLGQNRPQKQ